MPSHAGRVIIDTWRGQVRARAWPRSRGSRIDPGTLLRMEKFRQANILAKYLIAEQQQLAREVTNGTPLMPRDLLVAAMYGRLFAIAEPGERTLYPVAARADVSQSLDILGDTVATMLARGDQFWEPVGPGVLGQILTSQGPGALPSYEDAPAGVTSARVEASTGQSVGGGALTQLNFGSTIFDPDSAWNNPNSRWVIPAGVARASFVLQARTSAAGPANAEQLQVQINGVTFSSFTIAGATNLDISLATGPLPVAAGDFVTGWAFCPSTRVTFASPRNSFSMESLG